MGDSPSDSKDKASEMPAPEVLKPQDDPSDGSDAATPNTPPPANGQAPLKPPTKLRRGTYRPSHKATFIGLAVVIAILGINAGVVVYLIRGQSNNTQGKQDEVTISSADLAKLGVNRDPVGNKGTELIIGPDSRFNGKVTVGGDANIAGQLTLNSSFTAASASLTKLQAGDTAVNQLNVNGDGTVSTLNLRKDLNVVGQTKLQGATTVGGNLTVGGTLFANSFTSNFLTSGSTLTIGGHLIIRGVPPTVSAGSAVGSGGTVSISGNDTSGTVAVNVGVGGTAGTLASVTFHAPYDSTPHVVVTAINKSPGDYYINRSTTGFTISIVAPTSAAGYAFDYIVTQ
jgi:hypothetical protein